MTMTVRHGDRVLWHGLYDVEKIQLIVHDYPTRVTDVGSITIEVQYA